MATCKECIHFDFCEPYTAPDESYPEANGCRVFKNKDEFVQVVRCKDCKNYTPVEGGLSLCTLHNIAVSGKDFCSYGKRRAIDGNLIANGVMVNEPLTNCQRWIPVTERKPAAKEG